jgi:TPR repeat protein/ABC-type amino acid transport substrate-binding protein
MKRWHVFGLLCCFIGSGYDSARGADGAVTPAPLRIAMSGNYMPLHGYEGGQAVGLEAELGRAIAQKLGREAMFLDRNALGMSTLEALAAGRADLALNAISPTPERAAKVDFTAPYTHLKFRLFGRRDKIRSIQGSYVVAVGDAAMDAVYATTWNESLGGRGPASTMDEALKLLRKGEVHFVAAEDIAAIATVLADRKKLRLAEEPFGSSPIAMAVPKGEGPRYDAVLSGMTDLLHRLQERWVVVAPEETPLPPLEGFKKPDASRVSACDAGDARACAEVGRLLAEGAGTLKDATAALTKACDGDVPAACWALAPLESDQAMRSARWARYHQACTGGKTPYCALLLEPRYNGYFDVCGPERGESCLSGARLNSRCHEQTPCSPYSARTWFEMACKQGDADACTGLAVFLRDGWHEKKDLKRAAALLGPACAQGNQTACHELGSMRAAGVGMKRDEKGAVALFRSSCEAGQSEACTKLAQVLEKGRGVKADPSAAMDLYRQACNDMEARACGLLGQLMSTSADSSEKSATIRALFERACFWGGAEGCAGLAALTTSNDEERHGHLVRACTLRDRASCRNLVDELESGRHRDPPGLAKVYGVLCHFGDKAACEQAAELDPQHLPERSPQ